MKRTIVLLITITLLMTSVACGKKADEEEETVLPTPTVAIVVMNELPIHSDTWEDILNEEVPPPTPTPFVLSITSGRERAASLPYQPIFVCYNNASDNRPLSGILEADIVYEAPALSGEKGTRLIALFNDNYPVQSGPIGMTYSVFDILQKEWNGVLVHEGYPATSGYPRLSEDTAALRITNTGEAKDFFFTPEDLKGLFVNLNRLVPKLYTHKPVDEEIRFLLAEGYEYTETIAAPKLRVSFEDSGETVEFVYEKQSMRYQRYQVAANGRMANATALSWNEETKGHDTIPLSVNNIIVQYTQTGNSELILIGSGQCDFFVGGVSISGTWSKASAFEPTYYHLKDGRIVILETGCTWIILCPADNPAQILK